ncbi:hypothetical protein VNI00_008294 [Paramarasmius palmivorus]|uniref:Cytochrome b561 domain-containing protein n=1 Tax=Paramarasmius palmivorus TaxID=297713 RepID=A0AAW0CX24_9AGAR
MSEQVAIFWDYENCPAPFNASGFSLVNQIREIAHQFGGIKLFRAYADLSELTSSRSLSLRSELQCSGVSLIDCPHNGRKNVADQMIIVDMLAYAIDHSALDTILLISGDRDYAYAISTLRFRRYKVVVMAPSTPAAHVSLRAQASAFIDWHSSVLNALKDERSQFDVHPTPAAEPSIPARHCRTASQSSIAHAVPPNNIQPSRVLDASMVPPAVNHSVDMRHQEPLQRTPAPPPTAVEEVLHQELCERVHAPTPIPALPAYTPSLEPSLPTRADDAVYIKSYTHVRPHSAPPDAPAVELPSPEPISATAPIPPAPEVTPPAFSGNSTSNLTPQNPVPVSLPLPAGPGPSQDIHIQSVVTPSPIEQHVPVGFQTLMQILQQYHQRGVRRPFRTLVATELANRDKLVYKNVGVPRFREYTALAVSARLIEMGGKEAGNLAATGDAYRQRQGLFGGHSGTFSSVQLLNARSGAVAPRPRFEGRWQMRALPLRQCYDTRQYGDISTDTSPKSRWMGRSVGSLPHFFNQYPTIYRGFGRKMKDSHMVVLWENDDGSTTISQRFATGHKMPKMVERPPRIAWLPDSKPLEWHPDAGTSFSFEIQRDHGLIYNPSEPYFKNFIWAYSKYHPDSPDPGTKIYQHFAAGQVTLDFNKDLMQIEDTPVDETNVPTRPVIDTDNNSVDTTPPSHHQDPYSAHELIVICHGALVTIGFLVLLPFGSLAARWTRTVTPKWFKVHRITNHYIGLPVILIGWLLGPVAVFDAQASHFLDAHQICGLLLFAFYLLQIMLGRYVHKRNQLPDRKGHPPSNILHVCFGLFIVSLAFLQVRSGMNEWEQVTGRPGAHWTHVMWKVWVVFLPAAYLAGLSLLRRQFYQEQQGLGPATHKHYISLDVDPNSPSASETMFDIGELDEDMNISKEAETEEPLLRGSH